MNIGSRKLVAYLAFAVIFCLPLFALAGPPDPVKIIEKADDALRGKSSFSELTMSVKTKRWERQYTMKSWTEGREKSFILIMSPKKDTGTTFLKLKSEMWQYIPRVERKVKIPPSMMLQSWMGSDFTNDDLARDDSIITDYTHKLLGEEMIDGKPAWKIESIPREDAPVFWGKLISFIQKDKNVFRKQEFYDEDMVLSKVMMLDRLKDISGRTVPMRMTMTNTKKPGNKTVMVFDKMQFDIKIPKGTFTQRNLSRTGR